jgi:predicted GNAT family acetyltransferase
VVENQIAVTDNKAAHQYEARFDGALAFIKYELKDGRIVFIHTEVPEALEGHGIASALARAALEDAKARQLLVVPLCPFISGYIRKHAEYLPLVDQAYRPRLARLG